MRNYSTDYLSEFEKEFEAEIENTQSPGEQDPEMEFENEFEEEGESEFELEQDSENEMETDSENEMELEIESSYETRLYEIFNNSYESELEFENNLNEVLHEMEKDFFFGSLKKWVKKKGGIKGLLAKYAKKLPISGAVNAISSAARGDFRGALKNIASNGLLKTGLSFIPGGGMAVKGLDFVNKFTNPDSETSNVSMENVQQAVAVGKTAYDELAKNLVNARTENDIKDMGRKSLQEAIRKHKGGQVQRHQQRGRKMRIPYPPGSIVSIHPTFISIWQPS
jgi:hypothetical protein